MKTITNNLKDKMKDEMKVRMKALETRLESLFIEIKASQGDPEADETEVRLLIKCFNSVKQVCITETAIQNARDEDDVEQVRMSIEALEGISRVLAQRDKELREYRMLKGTRIGALVDADDRFVFTTIGFK